MELIVAYITIFVAILLGAISPGPSFIFISQRALSKSRMDGIAASFGMGIGSAVFATISVLGLHTILTAIPILYMVFKFFGGTYLLLLAFKIFRNSKNQFVVGEAVDESNSSLKNSLLLGFITQVSNPKTAIVIGSILASLLPMKATLLEKSVVIPMVFIIDTGWYTMVSVFLTLQKVNFVYLNAKTEIDRISAFIIGVLGIKLLLNQWYLYIFPSWSIQKNHLYTLL